MASQPKVRFTAEEYLALERSAEYRSEFVDGEIFAMAGGTIRHNLLAMRLAFLLQGQLGPECRVLSGDTKVHITAVDVFTYPDLSVTCLQHLNLNDDFIEEPTLIVEVLSPSTENYDRGRKFKFYRQLASLQQYVLISSERPEVEVHTRAASGDWNLHEVREGIVELPSVRCSMMIEELYSGVELP